MRWECFFLFLFRGVGSRSTVFIFSILPPRIQCKGPGASSAVTRQPLHTHTLSSSPCHPSIQPFHSFPLSPSFPSFLDAITLFFTDLIRFQRLLFYIYFSIFLDGGGWQGPFCACWRFQKFDVFRTGTSARLETVMYCTASWRADIFAPDILPHRSLDK